MVCTTPQSKTRKAAEPALAKVTVLPDTKREARLQYYEGIRQGMLEHIKTTEESLRKLVGIKPSKIEKLVAEVHKHHEKLLRRIDRQISQEKGQPR